MTTRLENTPMPPARTGWNPLTVAVAAALWIAVFANWPLWQALLALPETNSTRGAVFVSGFALMIAALLSALLALAAWRFSIKPVIALFVLAAAFGAHFMGAYGVVIDSTMMVNVVQTDPREVRDLLSLRLLFSVLLLAGLPLVLLWRVRLQRLGTLAQLGRNALGFTAALLVLAALVFALFADLSATMRNHKSMRYLINPLNSFYALADIGLRAKARPAGPPLPIGGDARIAPRTAGARAPLVLLVVGETARADHFALNGYERPTNPELAALDLVSFREVSSCGTNTAASLPCMFSHLGKARFEARERDSENLLDLVQRAGMAVLWLDNQAGCKGLCERVPNAQAISAAPGGTAPGAQLCEDGECLDEALLVGLDARLAVLPAEQRERGVLLVLHQMGSHGPAYYKRSPANRKPFMPECSTNVLQQCERASLINAYDNSIAYTDHVLAQTIGWLQGKSAQYDTTMLYLSDHGESLGENNLYLHGLPYALAPREQTHVPMIVWVAPTSAPATQAMTACMRERRDAPLTHDNLFHSVLGLLGIQAGEYQAGLDAFAACRVP
ncbi:MAG: phosphoethanolamine--lipid A transferase [Burkholderiaceae bacterium]